MTLFEFVCRTKKSLEKWRTPKPDEMSKKIHLKKKARKKKKLTSTAWRTATLTKFEKFEKEGVSGVVSARASRRSKCENPTIVSGTKRCFAYLVSGLGFRV